MYTCLLPFTCLCLVLASASANVTTIKHLRDPETLVSSNAKFKLGFFSPKNSSNRYIGIWYNIQELDELEVVWVANRDSPLTDSSGVLQMTKDGDLQLMDEQNKVHWSSNIANQTKNTTAQLLDTGNLVLISNATGLIVWQSFEHLTDSLLPPLKVTVPGNVIEMRTLRSWKSSSDPSSGRFTTGIKRYSFTEIITWDGDKTYWRSGPWNGNILLGVSFSMLSFNGFRLADDHDNIFYITYAMSNGSVLEHTILNSEGVISTKSWDGSSNTWKAYVLSPANVCDIYSKCGPNGSCDPNKSPICSCLKGFEPKNRKEWNKSNWTDGCVRRTLLQCNNTTSNTDGFLKLAHMKVPDYAEWLSAQDQNDCERKCSRSCLCSAYGYHSAFGCMTWNGSLVDIQQFSDQGVDLFIRLAQSELGKRTCVGEMRVTHTQQYNKRDKNIGTQKYIEVHQTGYVLTAVALGVLFEKYYKGNFT